MVQIHRELMLEIGKNLTMHQSPKYTMSMLTFFAALCQKYVNSSSLKLSDSVIIDDGEVVGTDLQRANIGDTKKINNGMDPLNIQWACSPSLQLHAKNMRIHHL